MLETSLESWAVRERDKTTWTVLVMNYGVGRALLTSLEYGVARSRLLNRPAQQSKRQRERFMHVL